jgi:hypothetical protein
MNVVAASALSGARRQSVRIVFAGLMLVMLLAALDQTNPVVSSNL